MNSLKRWLNNSSNAIEGNITPFTPTGDINDAIFVIHQSPDDPTYGQSYEPFNLSPCPTYFSEFDSNPGSWFNADESHQYFQKLIQSEKIVKDIEERMLKQKSTPNTDNRDATDSNAKNQKISENELRTPEEMLKLNELDDPNRIWKNKRSKRYKEFVQQKIRNIIEFKELCEKKLK